MITRCCWTHEAFSVLVKSFQGTKTQNELVIIKTMHVVDNPNAVACRDYTFLRGFRNPRWKHSTLVKICQLCISIWLNLCMSHNFSFFKFISKLKRFIFQIYCWLWFKIKQINGWQMCHFWVGGYLWKSRMTPTYPSHRKSFFGLFDIPRWKNRIPLVTSYHVN